jgi:putative cell wall-binding protein
MKSIIRLGAALASAAGAAGASGAVSAAGASGAVSAAGASASQAANAPAADAPTLKLVWEEHIADGGGGSYITLSSPNVATLTGGESVVVGDSSGHVYAYHLGTGSAVSGWPKNVGAPVTSTPSVAATTTGSPRDTVLVGTGSAASSCVGGYQWIYPDGSQTLVLATNPTTDTACAHSGVQASMAVGTLQGVTATVAGSLGQETYAMNAASHGVLAGFPWFQADSNFATPAIGAMEATGANQIVEGGASTAGEAYHHTYTNGGHIRILTASGGLICEDTTDESVNSSPAIGKFLAGSAMGIVAGTGPTYPTASQHDEIIAVNSACQQVWAQKLAGTTGYGSPALADVVGNGALQVVATTRTGGVYAFDGSSGGELWHTQLRYGVIGSPVTMALGTGHQDVVVASINGLDILTGTDGTVLVGTVTTTTGFENAPLVTEDPNGTIGITVAGHQTDGSIVYHYEVATSSGAGVDGTGTWPQFHHDPQLTGDAATSNTPPPPPFATFTRIYGSTADATAAAELEHQFPTGSGDCPGTTGDRAVVLATDATYPDALSSAYLARYLGTGTLLTPPTALSAPTLAAIHQEGITKVDVVGGDLAIDTAVVDDLESTPADACGGVADPGAADIEVTRISGPTQYDTAEKISELPPPSNVGSLGAPGAYGGTNGSGGEGLYNDTAGQASSGPSGPTPVPTAIVATGTGFPDAEAASTLAYTERLPILLTTPSTLSPEVSSAIGALGIRQVVVMGGQLAVSNAVASSLEGLGVSVLRIAGQTSSGTSVELAEFETGPAKGGAGLGWTGTGSVTVARGDGFTDGLAGAVVAADGPSSGAPTPLLLTLSPTNAGTALLGFLKEAGHTGIGGARVTDLTVLGGPFAITQTTINALGAALRS